MFGRGEHLFGDCLEVWKLKQRGGWGERLSAAEMFWEYSGITLGGVEGLELRLVRSINIASWLKGMRGGDRTSDIL